MSIKRNRLWNFSLLLGGNEIDGFPRASEKLAREILETWESWRDYHTERFYRMLKNFSKSYQIYAYLYKKILINDKKILTNDKIF